MSQHPYAGFMTELIKPGRYVGREPGAVITPWDEARVRICLAFPDVYEIGMSYLGFQILYHDLAGRADIACERAFAPWADLEAQLRARALPLVSLESYRPLADFDVVGFTLQYELTYTNLLAMLELGRVPLRVDARADDAPLVIAGGPLAMNPEPLSSFVDLFLMGDGEELLPAFLDQVARLRDAGLPRAERIRLLEAWSPAVSAPWRHGRVETLRESPTRRPARLIDLSGSPQPVRFPVPWVQSTFDRITVEIARGCIQGCRFCQAGYLYRPLREKPVGDVVEAVTHHVDVSGQRQVSLSSLSSADHSDIAGLVAPLAERGRQRGFGLAFSSLRAYGLPEAVLDQIAELGVSGITLAPEAGSQRLRDRINKNVDEAQILSAVRAIFSRGWKRVKLYFMIGLPGETDEDVLGIAALSRSVYYAAREALGRRPEVIVSVSNYVPKPHTPFQWEGMASEDELRRRQGLLRHAVARTRLRLKLHSVPMARVEGLVSLGDARVGELIARAYELGARFDGWNEHFSEARWREAEASIEVEGALDALLAPREPADPLPWDYVNPGVERRFLEDELARSRAGEPSPPCDIRYVGGRATRGPCAACGVACRPSSGVSPEESTAPGLPSLVVAATGEDGRSGDPSSRVPEERRLGDAPRTTEGVTSEQPFETPSEARLLREAVGQGERVEVRQLSPDALDGCAYHVRYARLDPTHLLGQNDAVRHLVRAIWRTGYKVELTRGFKPHPRISQSPALPLGYESLSEWLGLRFESSARPASAAALQARLDEVSVAGMPFLEVRDVARGDYRVRADQVGALRFRVRFSDAACAAEARARVEALAGIEVDHGLPLEDALLGPHDVATVVLRMAADAGLPFRPERLFEGVEHVVLLERA